MKKKRRALLPAVSNEELLNMLKRITVEQQSVLQRLKGLMASKVTKPEKIVEQIQALQKVGLRNKVLEKYSNIALGQVFQYFKESWEELPERFTQAYTDGHYGYIQEVYGLGSEMADMYAKVWTAFYSGQVKYKLPSYVQLSALPVARLNTAASYVLRNEMTPVRWKALSDRTLTMPELAMQLRRADDADDEEEQKGPKVNSTKSTVSRETGDIRMYVNGTVEQVGFLNMNSPNPLVLDEIRRICKDGHITVRR